MGECRADRATELACHRGPVCENAGESSAVAVAVAARWRVGEKMTMVVCIGRQDGPGWDVTRETGASCAVEQHQTRGQQGRAGRTPTDASRVAPAMDERREANANAPVPQWSGGRLEFVEIAVSFGDRGDAGGQQK